MSGSLNPKKYVFYFTLKALFILMIFNFFPDFFCHIGKRLHMKARVNLKTNDATNWEIDDCNTHIAQYLKN